MHFELLMTAALLVSGQTAPTPATDVAAELELPYAQAKLQLAEANLKRVEQINSKLSKSVPAAVVAEFRQRVDEAKVQVNLARSHAKGGEFGVWLRRAQSELETVQTRWKDAVAVNKRLKGTFEALDIERFRLRAEVARLQLARGKALVDAPRSAQLEWQAEMLNNQLERLNEESSRVAPFVRYYPIWWY